MLNLRNFNRLNQDAKAAFTCNECTYLISYAEDVSHTLSLYYASGAPGGDYFIELRYNPNNNYIDSVSAFKTHQVLEPYLKGIDISELFQDNIQGPSGLTTFDWRDFLGRFRHEPHRRSD